MAKNTSPIIEESQLIEKEIEMKIEVSKARNQAFEKQAAASIGVAILAIVAVGVGHALQALTEVKEPDKPESKT